MWGKPPHCHHYNNLISYRFVFQVCDAVTWVMTEGSSLFGADPSRVIAAGSSAGGESYCEFLLKWPLF